MPAVAVRQVERLNQKDPEAAPIVSTEMYDRNTGERICRGWKRVPSLNYPNFRIPAPEIVALGLRPDLCTARPGRYLVFNRETEETEKAIREMVDDGVLKVAA